MAVRRRTTYRTKAQALKVRGAGQRVYRATNGWRVSPQCPRAAARRRQLLRIRTKTRRANRRPKYAGLIQWVDVPF